MELKARQEIIALRSQVKLKDKEIRELKRKLKRKDTENAELKFKLKEYSYLILEKEK